jgi:hypothetical protein
LEYLPAAQAAQPVSAVLVQVVVRPEPAGQREHVAHGPLVAPADQVLPVTQAAQTVSAVALHSEAAPRPAPQSVQGVQGGRPEALKSTPATHALGGKPETLALGDGLADAEALVEALNAALAEGLAEAEAEAEADGDAEGLAELPKDLVAVTDTEPLGLGVGATKTLCTAHESFTVVAATAATLSGGTPVVAAHEVSSCCMSLELESAAGSPSSEATAALSASAMLADEAEAAAPPTLAACATGSVMRSCVKATGRKQVSATTFAPAGGVAHTSTSDDGCSWRRRRAAVFTGSVAPTAVKPSGVVSASTAPREPGTLTRLTFTPVMITPLMFMPPSWLAVAARRPWPKPVAPPPVTAASPPPTSGKVTEAV